MMSLPMLQLPGSSERTPEVKQGAPLSLSVVEADTKPQPWV
jgi:hypothetical protein